MFTEKSFEKDLFSLYRQTVKFARPKYIEVGCFGQELGGFYTGPVLLSTGFDRGTEV